MFVRYMVHHFATNWLFVLLVVLVILTQFGSALVILHLKCTWILCRSYRIWMTQWHLLSQATSLGDGLVGALSLVNPLSLFRFDALSRLPANGENTCHNRYQHTATAVAENSFVYFLLLLLLLFCKMEYGNICCIPSNACLCRSVCLSVGL